MYRATVLAAVLDVASAAPAAQKDAGFPDVATVLPAGLEGAMIPNVAYEVSPAIYKCPGKAEFIKIWAEVDEKKDQFNYW